MFDLLDRIDLRLCNKRVVEALICAGALDGVAGPGGRAQLLAGLDAAYASAQDAQRERESAQESLFGGGGTGPLVAEPGLPDVERWSESERLTREKAILGFFISGHPLDRFREEMRLFERVHTGNLGAHRDQKVELACVVTSVARQFSRKDGKEWGKLTVEDFHGTATVLAFGEVWEKHRETLAQDAPVLIRGAVSGRERDEDDPPIFLDSAVSLVEIRASGEVALCIELSQAGVEPERIARAKAALEARPGQAPLVVVWRNGEEEHGAPAPRFRSRTLRVSAEHEVLDELRELLGSERVRLERV